MAPTCLAFHGGLRRRLAWPKAGGMSAFRLLGGWSAAAGDSRAAFKYSGVLRQWLPHVLLQMMVWDFFSFLKDYIKNWFKCVVTDCDLACSFRLTQMVSHIVYLTGSAGLLA